MRADRRALTELAELAKVLDPETNLRLCRAICDADLLGSPGAVEAMADELMEEARAAQAKAEELTRTADRIRRTLAKHRPVRLEQPLSEITR